jgi:multicomponent K+:H+ antiporter subunit G
VTQAAELPAWAALLAALLLLLGAGLGLVGAIGLLRLGSFYERLHAPTLATTLGIGCVLLASMLVFSLLQGRLVLPGILLGLLMVATTPVTLMLLSRAALYRDRAEGDTTVSPPRAPVERAQGDRAGLDG